MSEILDTFEALLKLAVENGASDIHIKTGKSAILRIDGSLEEVEMPPFTAEMIKEFIHEILPAQMVDSWKKKMQADFGYHLEGVGRFRINAFHQRSTPSIVFRHIKNMIPSFADLHLPASKLKRFCEKKSGLLLICGPTGSGKSSTMAAMLNYVNENFDKHIVTLEDPIEFFYTDKKSMFNQREIGLDTPNYREGMRAVLRQDPDIILVGEMRDADTFETAMRAAETGHLVIGTLHAGDAKQAIQRLFDYFPSDQQEMMQRQISSCLLGIISQMLAPSSSGQGRYPVQEYLIVNSLVQDFILKGEFSKIPAVIESDSECQTYNGNLLTLVEAGNITKETALKFSPNPKQLEMNLKGIFLNQGGIVN